MTTSPVPDARAVDIHVLGIVRATSVRGDIAVGGPRARALLAKLVEAEGRVLSADALLQAVWGTTSPGVRSALRATVSRWRATPLDEHLLGGRRGYALRPGPFLRVDLWRLGTLSLDDLVDAVDAVPFDGVADAPFLAPARTAAREQLRHAVIRSLDAHPSGTPRSVALERLGAHHPDDPELRALRAAGGTDGALLPAQLRDARPATTTRRIGLLAPIAAYLSRPEAEARLAGALRLSRLVTLVGPAGVGKSRLAIEWARGSGGDTQEHIWFCRAGGGGQWLHEVSRLIGADDETLESVAHRLSALRGTLVIDGLDGAPADAPALAVLLEGAPGVTALVCARQPLGVPGESALPLGTLGRVDARRLFSMRSSNTPDEGDLDALLAAVGRLPLAIELAAAHAAQSPLPTVLDTLWAPTGSGQNTPLEAAMAATLALLSSAARVTLARLCAFRGPFSRESALALAGEGSSVDIDALIAWSLVTRESSDGGTVLEVPEIVRRALGGGDHADPGARALHTAWFAERTRAAFDELTTTAASAAWHRLQIERPDIDQAFEHAVADGDRAAALSISAGLAWVGLMSGTQAAVLALSRRAAHVSGDALPGVEARAGLGRGILAYQLGFMDEAADSLDRALRFSRSAREDDLLALSHAFIAYLATLTPDGARRAVENIRDAQRGDSACSAGTRAMVTLIAAQVERAAGERSQALRHTAAARDLAANAGHAWAHLMSAVVAAKIHLDDRQPRRALSLLREELSHQRILDDPISVLIAVSVAAGAAAGIGADAASARIIGAVDTIGPRYGFDPRANEPADFERYRRRAREGLTGDAWQDAYAHGSTLTLAELVEEVTSLVRTR